MRILRNDRRIQSATVLQLFSKSFSLKEMFRHGPDFVMCALQNNVMVFIAELFWWFENVKPDFVQPRDLQDVKDGTAHFLL